MPISASGRRRMRDEASLRRLIEMGVDVYVPRVSRERGVGASAPNLPTGSRDARARVLVLARGGDDTQPLLAQVMRALQFARFEGSVETSADAGRVADAAGLVVFGETLAREVGALLPASREGNPHGVAAADLAGIRTDAAAKRALWSELRRLIRALRAGAG